MGIPQGLVILWSGTSNTIPSGWFVCDGTNGTPDLRDRFVIGAGSTYAFNTTGGSANTIVPTHNHAITEISAGGNHGHGSFGWSSSPTTGTNFMSQDQAVNGAGPYIQSTTTATNFPAHTHTGGTLGNNGEDPVGKNIPPYYSLFYIMKGGS